MTGYLESTDEKFAIQHANFSSKMDLYATDFGFTAAEVDSIKKDSLYNNWVDIVTVTVGG